MTLSPVVLPTTLIDGTTADAVDVMGDLNALLAGVNELIGETSRGAVSIAASESTSSTSYAKLATHDEVTGIVLPANGLIRVWYQATWQESVGDAARAAIFLNSNQLKTDVSNAGAPQTQAAAKSSDTPGVNGILASCPLGLLGTEATAYSGDVTTGQAIGMWTPGSSGAGGFAEIGGVVETIGDATGYLPFGGPCDIFAAAGTYTVSVQFKASSGSVTASNRKLWVRALPFS